jgi:small subunit ribosomal protein S16
MVKIRLKRFGQKKAPKYRVVVIDGRDRRDGAPIAEIGFYDPKKQPAEIRIDVEAAQKWIQKGAQPSDTVRELLRRVAATEAAK